MLFVMCLTALALPLLGVMALESVQSHARAVLMWGLTADAVTIL